MSHASLRSDFANHLQSEQFRRSARQSDHPSAYQWCRELPLSFNNNVVERAVCMPKVKYKISGCCRTLGGTENCCIIRSCLDTLRK